MRVLALALIGLAGAGAWAEEPWREADWRGREARVGDFRLVEADPAGGCGEHDFAVYRANDRPEFSYCARGLKYRMRGRIPDFLISGIRVGSAVGGPSNWVFEDVLLRYEKGRWSETVIMAVQSGPTGN
jgi:hypothetical protein